MGGGGLWLRDAGRGLQESPESHVIAVIGKTKTYHGGTETQRTTKIRGSRVAGKAGTLTTKDTKELKGKDGSSVLSSGAITGVLEVHLQE